MPERFQNRVLEIALKFAPYLARDSFEHLSRLSSHVSFQVNRPMSVLTRITILFSLLGVCSTASADDWAKKMFTETAHDFRTVAAVPSKNFILN